MTGSEDHILACFAFLRIGCIAQLNSLEAPAALDAFPRQELSLLMDGEYSASS
jgi:hypothetical protein